MKYHWLSSFLKLPGGVPSHDTFNRVLCLIDAEQFQQSFVNFLNEYEKTIFDVKEILIDNSEWNNRYEHYARKILKNFDLVKEKRRKFSEWSALNLYMNVTT